MKNYSFKKACIDFFLTILAYIMYYIFRYLVPLKAASKFGYLIGYYLISNLKLKKKEIFLKNINFVFPSKSKEEIFNIYRLSCVNFSQNLFELPKISFLKKYVTLKDPYNLIEYIHNPNNPGLFFTGHIGNWELIGLPFLNTEGYGIYKKPSNPFINKLFLKMRLQYNKECKFKMITLNRPKLIKLVSLAKNRHLRLTMLVDQKVNEGILANFMGKKVYTSHLLPMFAIKYKIPLIPIRVIRDFNSKRLHFIISIEKPLDLSNLKNNTEDILTATEMMNNTIGKWIKNNPEQWFWLYNRWK